MPAETLNSMGIIRTLIDRGWGWCDGEDNVLVHPDDHALRVKYDAPSDRLTVSPELDAHLARIIPTPASKGRFRR